MLTELTLIIILLLLALSFHSHYGTHKNIRILFDEKVQMWKEIDALKEQIQDLKKHD